MLLKDSNAVLIAAGDRAPRKRSPEPPHGVQAQIRRRDGLGRGGLMSLRSVPGTPPCAAQRLRMTAKRDEGQGQRPLHSGAGEALVFHNSADPGVPEARGLYDPALDKDSCGVGFIADIKG